MNNGKKNKTSIKVKIQEFVSNIYIVITILFQYIPTASLWHGLMSIPIITYLGYILTGPNPLFSDLSHYFFLAIILLFPIIYTIYSFIYYLKHRGEGLITTGPYEKTRNPQYFGLILILTIYTLVVVINTAPIGLDENQIVIIWLVEVIIYLILAKIEGYSLSKVYPEEYKEYKKSTWFLIPKIRC